MPELKITVQDVITDWTSEEPQDLSQEKERLLAAASYERPRWSDKKILMVIPNGQVFVMTVEETEAKVQ